MVSKPVEEKTREELIEQIRRMQERAGPELPAHNKGLAEVRKRCANYREGMRQANVRADRAEARLRIIIKAFAEANAVLGETNNG